MRRMCDGITPRGSHGMGGMTDGACLPSVLAYRALSHSLTASLTRILSLSDDQGQRGVMGKERGEERDVGTAVVCVCVCARVRA